MKYKLKKNEKEVLSLIKKEPTITVTNLAKKTGKTRQGIYKILKRLTTLGVLTSQKAVFIVDI